VSSNGEKSTPLHEEVFAALKLKATQLLRLQLNPSTIATDFNSSFIPAVRHEINVLSIVAAIFILVRQCGGKYRLWDL
jgi:hypothetical protein